ncbi:MAG: OmpA family protein [Saprospiraceae bacterium]|jgi:chemotaxis protein MotB|nr:OmpA family protein [Saprospiraceae bacterium]MBP9210653.1 OmpA family protein [Saprospiraceae bacterium]MBV6473851.1 hypothetical protein [Saprospiraceae bacterium]
MKKLSYLVLAVTLMASCVSSKKYKDLEARMSETEMSLQKCNQKLSDCENEKSKLVDDCKMKTGKLESDLAAKEGKVKSLEDQMDMLRKTNNNLLDRLADLSIVSKSGAESIRKTLDVLNEKDKQINALNKAMAQKDSMMLTLVLNLKRSLAGVSSDDVNIEVKQGVVFISLSDKMLFRTASAVINDNAGKVLEKIAKVLNDHKDLNILVEGHTDNVPMSSECVADNWDLSAKRATSVVRQLQARYKVEPSRMTAGGRSEYAPKVANTNAEGRQKNRRTEIIILPKLDQFFDLLNPRS